MEWHKHSVGDIVTAHCCNGCAQRAGVSPKYPADSGMESWPCEVCGHYGIGSKAVCVVEEWLTLRVMRVYVEAE